MMRSKYEGSGTVRLTVLPPAAHESCQRLLCDILCEARVSCPEEAVAEDARRQLADR